MPPGLLIGLGMLVAFIAATARRASAATPAPAPSDSLKRIVGSGDPKKIAKAAVAAQNAGQPELAQTLAKHAVVANVRQKAAAVKLYPSPFKAIAADAWNAYVAGSRGTDPKQITPAYFLGLYGLGMRRLVDLGLASNPKKVMRNGREVWDADWAEALKPGPDKFLADVDMQYKAFAKMTSDDWKKILATPDLAKAVGTEIDGTKATMSGLLAVAKMAGVAGLKEWLSSADARAKHASTTAQFKKLNAIF